MPRELVDGSWWYVSTIEILMTCGFNAPRTLVWDAISKPELLKLWLFGPPGWSMVLCEDDLRVGGTFRWVWRGPDGAGMSMRGTYREIVPPELRQTCGVVGGDTGAERVTSRSLMNL